LNRKRDSLTFEERMSKFQETPHLDTGVYYYVVAEEGGKRHILGAFYSEDEAQSAATRNLDCFYRVIASRTRDRAEFTRRWKYGKLEETHNLANSTKRVKHKVKGDRDYDRD
jgi:hypothetical protein